ncbi:ankyrin repeat domain-containing protein [Microvirga sp. VF16]|uniref:ankyrin repeat domain-containing protein n=1 Tax=Microvirga sp. VF16 TaxID=2807101 RepID=UPI00193E89EF|nr:ankyrin repeat domain-containing protein [Microvirga sp. VF16]QRM29954.1 ankyrin repeat domain-containing protein [Microvirga sp. VF16]
MTSGAIIDARDAYDRTPLHIAARQGHVGTARLPLTNGTDVNARATNKMTPLHHAILNNKTEMARMLLDYHADIEAESSNGGTPMYFAASYGVTGMIELFAAKRAKLQGARRWDGTTPLSEAERNGHQEAADLLRRLGATHSPSWRNPIEARSSQNPEVGRGPSRSRIELVALTAECQIDPCYEPGFILLFPRIKKWKLSRQRPVQQTAIGHFCPFWRSMQP